MINALALLVGSGALTAIAAGVVVHRAGRSTTELDADIAQLSD